jgi:SAM-dependent methyltransferase
MKALVERAADISPRIILNAGAGEGLFTDILLAVRGTSCIVELDCAYTESRRVLRDSRLHLVAASLTDVPLANGSVDFILCSEVLEHIDDDGVALDELSRVLSPGGMLLITVPTPPAVYDPNHVREGYASDQLSLMLKEREFEILEIRFCMYGAFQLIMRLWRRYGWLPKAVMWVLARIDRRWHVGTPMDLMILGRSRVSSGSV